MIILAGDAAQQLIACLVCTTCEKSQLLSPDIEKSKVDNLNKLNKNSKKGKYQKQTLLILC